MNFSLKKLSTYCQDHSTSVQEILSQLERETHLKTLSPQMISGPLQGQLFSIISKIKQPRKILEIGTFTGYAAICLAQGLTSGGSLTTIESNIELKHISEKFFAQAGLAETINQLWGDAKKIVPTLDDQYDLIYIDAGKKDYGLYFDLVIENLNPEGIILVDNVLWSGKVVNSQKDKDTAIMDAFNKKILHDQRVEQVMLPIRDGLTIILKK